MNVTISELPNGLMAPLYCIGLVEKCKSSCLERFLPVWVSFTSIGYGPRNDPGVQDIPRIRRS